MIPKELYVEQFSFGENNRSTEYVNYILIIGDEKLFYIDYVYKNMDNIEQRATTLIKDSLNYFINNGLDI